MPNLVITIGEQLSTIAGETTMDLQGLISTMKASGMDNKAIKDVLINDLRTGGRLFGNYRNQIKNTVQSGIGISGGNSSRSTFEKAGVKQYRWTAIGDKRVCPDCEPRHGEVDSLEFWKTVGLPQSGFSICRYNCRCQLVPVDYKDKEVEQPILRSKQPRKATEFRMGGKHKSVKDSLSWMKENIADKVQINQIKDIDVLNEITQSLKSNFQKYNLNRLNTIKFRKGKAWASANGGTLRINQSHFTKEKLKKGYDSTNTNWQKRIDLWNKSIINKELLLKEAKDMGNTYWIKYYKKDIKQLKKLRDNESKYKRHNVLNKNNIARSIIDHEIGHVIHDQYTGMRNGFSFLKNKNISQEIRTKWNNEWISIFNKVKQDGTIYKISDYASVNNRELFAESFAMYVDNQKLPQIIKNYLDRYIKEFK